jgi:hypothetical protein
LVDWSLTHRRVSSYDGFFKNYSLFEHACASLPAPQRPHFKMSSAKQSGKKTQSAPARATPATLTERASAARNDARFRKFPQKRAQLVADDRFAAVFTDIGEFSFLN